MSKKSKLQPTIGLPSLNRGFTSSLTRRFTYRLHNLIDFHPNELEPYLLFDVRESMGSSGFLDSVATLSNLSEGPNAGGDATQTTALNQPKALPLIDGKGYLYLSGVTGNYASVPDASNLDGFDDFTLEFVGTSKDWHAGLAMTLIGKWTSSGGYFIRVQSNGTLFFLYNTTAAQNFHSSTAAHNLVDGAKGGIRVVRDGSSITFYENLYTGNGWQQIGSPVSGSSTTLVNGSQPLEVGTYNSGGSYPFNGSVSSSTVWNSSSPDTTSPVLDIDFNANHIPHGATEFQCDSGQVVTINQSGNDPATVIKKPVLRFDGANDGLNGLFNQTITGGHMFAAFSVLGDGGESNGRVFSVNSTASSDTQIEGYIPAYGGGTGLYTYGNGTITSHAGMYDEANGDLLFETKFEAGNQLSKVNNADLRTNTANLSDISSEEFNLASNQIGGENAAIDLEYLALFPATLTDAQAADVVNYVNNRNNVFDLIDSQGHYFFDPLSLSAGAVTTWNGRIVGSDNGDTNLNITQATGADQPDKGGMVVTFADTSDHLDMPSTSQAGYQIVGTSLGTFAYKVDSDAVTELNLLGNLGSTSNRKTGDLYGIILLPSTATGKDIADARQKLIDRGAADGTTTSNYYGAWTLRADITEFRDVDFTGVTNVGYGWNACSSLTTFNVNELPAATYTYRAWRNTSLTSFNTELPVATDVSVSWYGCSSLTSFSTELPVATNVSYGWYGCSSLASFDVASLPAATDVSSGWRESGLTSFSTELPAATNVSNAWGQSGLTSFNTELPVATNVSYGWYYCTSLTSFNVNELPAATNVSAAWNVCTSLTSFSTDLPAATNVSQAWRDCYSLTSFDVASLPTVTNAYLAWYNCWSLTSFSTELPACGNFGLSWYSCNSLTDFSADVFANWNPASISNGVFNNAWTNCTSLTAQSVENILTSIDSSDKHATSTGLSGGSALADAGIDISYNVSTGSLSAATTAAITSLKAKGWGIIINGTTY